MKLNRWQIIGLWLSTLWLVGVTMFDHHNLAAGVVPILTIWLVGYGIALAGRLFRSR